VNRFVFMAILAIATLVITWRGKKISAAMVVATIFSSFAICISLDGPGKIETTNGEAVGIIWSMIAANFGQFFLWVWFSTSPPVCRHCGK